MSESAHWSVDLAEDDRRDVIHRLVACLARGGVARAPCESQVVELAAASQPTAVQRLFASRPFPSSLPSAVLLRSPEELADWVPALPVVARRAARRGWPGSLVLAFGDSDAAAPAGPGLVARLGLESSRLWGEVNGGRTAFHCPADLLVREVVRLMAGPILMAWPSMASSNGSQTSGEASSAATNTIDLLVESPHTVGRGLNEPGMSGIDPQPTVLLIENDQLSVLRAGRMDQAQLRGLTGMVVLFVCTGNTCRSPMAEALCKAQLARRLNCAIEELPERGYTVISAGVAAYPGCAASPEAVEVVAERGGELSRHSSRQITDALVAQADLILAMTREHRLALLNAFPDVAERTHLLHRAGENITDPIGAGMDVYWHTAELIEEQIQQVLDKIGF